MKVTTHLLNLVVLSIICVVFNSYVIDATNIIYLIYNEITGGVSYLFQDGPISLALDFILSVFIILMVIYYPPKLLYKLIKKKPLPYRQHFFWFTWAIICFSIVIPLFLLGHAS